jgi:hypothetical protein
MTTLLPIDPARHAQARMRLPADPSRLRFVRLGLSELGPASADFPVCLAKEVETGRFNLIALLSLAEPRNLYWHAGAWQATYVPMAARLLPFRLDPHGVCGLAVDEVLLSAEGQPLFAPDGQPSEVVKAASVQLQRLVEDIAAAQALVDRLAALRLIRPIQCRLGHADGHTHRIDGLFTLDTDGLADDTVVELHHGGGLAAAAIMRASLAQLERLRRLHNLSAENPVAGLTVAVDE